MVFSAVFFRRWGGRQTGLFPDALAEDRWWRFLCRYAPFAVRQSVLCGISAGESLAITFFAMSTDGRAGIWGILLNKVGGPVVRVAKVLLELCPAEGWLCPIPRRAEVCQLSESLSGGTVDIQAAHRREFASRGGVD